MMLLLLLLWWWWCCVVSAVELAVLLLLSGCCYCCSSGGVVDDDVFVGIVVVVARLQVEEIVFSLSLYIIVTLCRSLPNLRWLQIGFLQGGQSYKQNLDTAKLTFISILNI
jgi:hypothetical protein